MEFFDVVNGRHSIRAFQSQSIGTANLERILDAVNRAPSAGNLQAYEIYLVTGSARKAALADAAEEFLTQPPVLLVFCAHPELSASKFTDRGPALYSVQDATIACTYAMLAASALGLSTVWVGGFDEEVVRHIIEAPQGHRPVAILPIGYAAELPAITSRRNLSELVHSTRS